MTQDPIVAEIQTEFLEANRLNRRWIILEANGQFEVHTHTSDGVAPPSVYPTARRAVARIMQLMNVGPVAPQTWPEEVCVGSVTFDDDGTKQPHPS